MSSSRRKPFGRGGLPPLKTSAFTNQDIRRNSNISLPDISKVEEEPREEKKEKYRVNPALHLTSDVPEQVQKFIRSISRQRTLSDEEEENTTMPEVKKTRRPCRRGSLTSERESEFRGKLRVHFNDQPEVAKNEDSATKDVPKSKSKSNLDKGSTKSLVEVIVTSEYEEDKLSNRQYDKLKKDTRFSEYEIAQLWSSFRKDFPKGKINRVQLTQLIKTVFPK